MIYCNLRLLYWLYPLYGFIGTYFLRYIHELISFIHFMMNSCYSFMCSYMVLWLLLSLDMIGMFPYILLYCYPYVIPTIHVVINHRYFFLLVDYGYVVGCPTILFYYIEVNREECYIK
nr:MAG TPA: hypothetical protein [Caudoviricetes sp.]